MTIMRIKNILYAAAASLILLSGCSDFLDRTPLSDNVNEGFFTEENQLEPYCNKKYELLPDFKDVNPFTKDNDSDNQTANDPNDNFLPQRIVVPEKDSYNKHGHLRDCNRFLYYTAENLENGTLTNSVKVQQYIGEMYFFRAYVYFDYLKKFGDFPIVTTELNDADYAATVEANKRKPRNEVARFILEDLDKAAAHMESRSNAITNHRLNKETALLFKSRVALYEGTWEKYHQGTARVPGGPGWPGGSFSGNLDEEINFFLTQAMDAAKQIAEAIPLEKAEDYINMFNQHDLSSKKEVLLWRMYSADAQVQSLIEGGYHGINEDDGCVGGGGGYTRSMIETFLCTNGLPIYAAGDQYKGDKNTTNVTTNRDNRLIASISKPGDLIWRGKNMDKEMRMVYPNMVHGKYNFGATATGYVVRKGWVDSNVSVSDNSPLAYMIFRAAEAYLNYMEADYVKNGNLDAYSQKYWKALRERAMVDTDFRKTIAATDLSKENDLAVWSGSDMVDPTLYNIRRERRSEFIAEGMRKDDLYRWRSLDKMKDFYVEGFNFWEENAQLPAYQEDLKNGLKVSETKYVRPHFQNALVIQNNGYQFEEANYLSPLSYDIFRLSTPEKGGDISTSVVYQNPGWPVDKGGTALR